MDRTIAHARHAERRMQHLMFDWIDAVLAGSTSVRSAC
jgi:hypothetical protein